MRYGVDLVIHRVTRAVSGEGRVVRSSAEVLREKGVNARLVTFSPPLDDLGLEWNSLIPFHIRLFDRYQRFLVYYAVKRNPAEVILNLTGVPIPLSSVGTHILYAVAPEFSSVPSKYNSSLIWNLYLLPLRTLIPKLREEARKAVVISNSRYSAKAFEDTYGVRSEVIYPPVDVDRFSRAYHERGGDYVITIGRFEEGKRLENSILLAKESGLPLVIVGASESETYPNKLRRIIKRLEAPVKIFPNASEEELVNIVKGASAYFHPTPGEHFGIPIIEAMAAGLVPVVPKQSGGAEVVPEFSYSNMEEALSMIKNAFSAPPEIRKEMRERANQFRKERFKKRIWDKLSQYIG